MEIEITSWSSDHIDIRSGKEKSVTFDARENV